MAPSLDTHVNAALVQSQNVLTTAHLLLEMSAQGGPLASSSLPLAPVPPASQACNPAYPSSPAQASLRAVCNETVRLLARAGDPPPVQFVLADGSAAYGYRLLAHSKAGEAPIPSDAAARLAQATLGRMAALGLDPLVAARTRQAIWLQPPPGIGFDSELVLEASLVTSNGQPYAIAFTSVSPNELLQQAAVSELASTPALLDEQGDLVAGELSPAEAYRVNARLAETQDGRFVWIQGYGWGLRLPPLVLGFGHIIVALPLDKQLYMMRGELILIAAATLSLIVMLLAMYRYWNRQFLTRTYAQASRAVEGEMLNHLMVHATPVGLCIVRRKSFDIVVANQIVRAMLGLDESATQLPAALRAEFAALNVGNEARDGQERIAQLQFSLKREDSPPLHLEITCAPAVLNREEVLFCAIADVTDRREAERLLREAQQTSEASARAKVGFFASMSHELRTPLASLVGNLELVALGPLAPEQEARVHAMQVSATGLLQVVNDVLDFSKIDIGEMRLDEEWHSVPELLVRIVAGYAPLANRQALRLYLVIEPGCPSTMLFDPIRVSQILNNLLGNAFKFTHSGKIIVRARWSGSHLELSVTDSGVGISDDLKRRLFQPFTQGADHRLTDTRGTGLGLSICLRLCTLMNGRIEVESTRGVGTRITVTLPLRASEGLHTWAMPGAHPAILCRASAYREWLTGLFDPQDSTASLLTDIREPIRPEQYDYLLVTDEFSSQEVSSLWPGHNQKIWVRQDGPLLPVMRQNGDIEVSVFSPSGIRSAIQMLRSQPGQITPPQPIRSSASGKTFGQLNVLIAEDNLLNRGLLRDQLRTLGAGVVEAAHGEEALRMLEKDQVDVVLTDIDMPVMNGSELLQAIRVSYPSMPVYAVSASASAEDIAKGRAQGFTDYLSKPVPLVTLAGVLDAAANRDNTSNEPAESEVEIPCFPALPASFAQIFVQQADRDLAGLRDVLEARDMEGLRKWAHGVSGGLSVLGPSMLFEECQELRSLIVASPGWCEDIEELALSIGDGLTKMREMHAQSIERRRGTV
ncbi:hybrid sensor histidine kinase/response regulator [Burkholderia sp. 4M9327F10]|uniref:hybrid sensor histidine kinase/response regulator n=1 Tax=Burkholderia sp. 4M9327F10 TaxID=2502223 RepID=UPI0014854A7B|nr:hybrid sensor histidine kinase/response regulator [Burkholderia sp. 4M9327F10]